MRGEGDYALLSQACLSIMSNPACIGRIEDDLLQCEVAWEH